MNLTVSVPDYAMFSYWTAAGQMAVRAAFDEDWLMNPSKVFPLEGRG